MCDEAAALSAALSGAHQPCSADASESVEEHAYTDETAPCPPQRAGAFLPCAGPLDARREIHHFGYASCATFDATWHTLTESGAGSGHAAPIQSSKIFSTHHVDAMQLFSCRSLECNIPISSAVPRVSLSGLRHVWTAIGALSAAEFARAATGRPDSPTIAVSAAALALLCPALVTLAASANECTRADVAAPFGRLFQSVFACVPSAFDPLSCASVDLSAHLAPLYHLQLLEYDVRVLFFHFCALSAYGFIPFVHSILLCCRYFPANPTAWQPTHVQTWLGFIHPCFYERASRFVRDWGGAELLRWVRGGDHDDDMLPIVGLPAILSIVVAHATALSDLQVLIDATQIRDPDMDARLLPLASASASSERAVESVSVRFGLGAAQHEDLCDARDLIADVHESMVGLWRQQILARL